MNDLGSSRMVSMDWCPYRLHPSLARFPVFLFKRSRKCLANLFCESLQVNRDVPKVDVSFPSAWVPWSWEVQVWVENRVFEKDHTEQLRGVSLCACRKNINAKHELIWVCCTGTSWIPIIRSLGAIKGEGLGNDFNADIGGVIKNLDIPAWVDLISVRERATTSEERSQFINDFGLEPSMFPKCAHSACKCTFKSLKKMKVFIYRQPFIVKILLIFAHHRKPMQSSPIKHQYYLKIHRQADDREWIYSD